MGLLIRFIQSIIINWALGSGGERGRVGLVAAPAQEKGEGEGGDFTFSNPEPCTAKPALQRDNLDR